MKGNKMAREIMIMLTTDEAGCVMDALYMYERYATTINNRHCRDVRKQVEGAYSKMRQPAVDKANLQMKD